MNTEAIIFDFGGVLLPVDYEAVVKAFAALDPDGNAHAYTQQKQLPLFDAFERGEMSPAEFLRELQNLFPRAAERQLLDAWNAILGQMPEARLLLLEKIRRHYRIFLLSNTNAIHAAHFEEQFRQRFGRLPDTWFDAVYYSHECGFRKPEKAIFDLVLLENNLNAGRTLFFEDTFANIQGALQAGIPSVFVNIPEGRYTEQYFDTENGSLNTNVLETELLLP